ncbi:MAG: hydroxymethylglutaryl-CoA synthase [Promethearchaeia archaeon]
MNKNDELFSGTGIESIGFYAPRHFIDLEELAVKRGVDPDKFKIGLMLNEMRIPQLDEDIIAMGTKAGHYALMRGNINPNDIDAVFVGTETMTYAVKSVSTIFSQLLGISDNSITQDVTNACASGTLAILNAIALVDREIINKALVICADISSYELKSPSEPTQGAGAIALVISKSPRIARFSKKFGKVSGNVTDFFRVPSEKNAQVFGKYSVKSYLNFQLKAYDDLMENQIGEEFYSNYYTFHAPFSKLPVKCMQQIIENRWIKDIKTLFDTELKDLTLNFFQKFQGFFQNILQKTFTLPEYIYLKLKESGLSSQKMEGLSRWIQNHFQKKLLPQLRVPSHFGNMYSASVWAQILYILEQFAKPEETIYFGSYGSGATCISGLLKVQKGVHEVLNKGPRMSEFIEDRKVKLSIEEYEQIKKGSLSPEIAIGKIKEHAQNEDRGFTLHFCDKGCIIPPIEGLNHCPRGHEGFHTKFFPLYATLESKPIVRVVEDMSFLNEDYIRVNPQAHKGSTLEYEVRRIGVMNEDKEHNMHGILNWVPTYNLTNKIY